MSELQHYGTPRHSGRYPYGSGENPYQRARDFLADVDELRKKGLSEKEIAEGKGMNTRELRAKKTMAIAEKRKYEVAMAVKLRDKGYSYRAIGERMGINESSVRSLLDPTLKSRSEVVFAVADKLRETVDEKGYLDVGVGTEVYMGVKRTKLKASIDLLKEEGYVTHNIPVQQLGTGKETNVLVLAPPGTTFGDVVKNKDKIGIITDYSEDGGKTFRKLEPPRSISSDRVKIRYNEEGGIEKDGVIELRRGVEELSLGDARYAQVRIAVDGTHYLKGMAMYSDDIPDGVDIVFNTNKHSGTPKMEVLKKMKDDPDNPFGATIKGDERLVLAQRHYKDKDGKEQLSAINIVSEEGNWGDWNKTISSQFLAKQSPALAKKQLGIYYDKKKAEYDEIMSLTNPAIKKKLLESFADDCDSSAVHLQAAGLPRQGWHVILPFPKMKPTEIYAPNYNDGEEVVLVRYPHGGIFEIPRLTVNNRFREANRLIKNAPDAVGINAKVAEQLSGADFDGDTVLVIPTRGIKIKSSSPLQGLKDFDPKEAYPYYEGMKVMSARTKQLKMGDISNLITDMTIKGATEDELARAVRHSMVVIDAEKHKLDYKRSYEENRIAELKEIYQGGASKGSSTLISKAKSPVRVDAREEGRTFIDPVTGRKRREFIDPETGKKLYTETGESYTKTTIKNPNTGKRVNVYTDKETGEKYYYDTTTQTKVKVTDTNSLKTQTIPRTSVSSKMAEADDAFELSSGTLMETVYAEHANKLKALANQARKSYLETPSTQYSPSAAKTYASEVASLKAKLQNAIKNAPLERRAQLLANQAVDAKRRDNPDMDNDSLKKLRGRELTIARIRTGAAKERIKIEPKEWEAIQAGAISNNLLGQILNNTDLDRVKQYATPRVATSLSPSVLARARSLLASGATQAEVADVLGVSASTLNNALK